MNVSILPFSNPHSIAVLLPQLSPKPSLTADGQVSSPGSVSSSANPSSQLEDGPAPSQEDVKMEVKEEEEDDEGADTEGEGKGKMGKGQHDVKTEKKPEVRFTDPLILMSQNSGKVLNCLKMSSFHRVLCLLYSDL